MRVPYKTLIERYANKFFSKATQCELGNEIFTRNGSIVDTRTNKEKNVNEKKKKSMKNLLSINAPTAALVSNATPTAAPASNAAPSAATSSA